MSAILAKPGAGEAGPVGLVYTSTSPTHSTAVEQRPEGFVITAKGARLERMRRSVITTARLVCEGMTRVKNRVAFLTLTYAGRWDWRPDHMSEFIKRLRAWCVRRGFVPRYVWVAELQERGAVHYHIAVWLPKGINLPKPDKQGWWTHGSTRIEWARAVVGYLAKYVSKGSDTGHAIPRGLRLTGSGGLSPLARDERAWWFLPSYVREVFEVADRTRRAAGGGFRSLVTGEWMDSRYRVVGVHGGCIHIALKVEYRELQAAA